MKLLIFIIIFISFSACGVKAPPLAPLTDTPTDTASPSPSPSLNTSAGYK